MVDESQGQFLRQPLSIVKTKIPFGEIRLIWNFPPLISFLQDKTHHLDMLSHQDISYSMQKMEFTRKSR